MEKLYGLLGYPVGHSMSPSMHNKAFEDLKVAARYMAFEVEPQNLQNAVEAIRSLQLGGCNVTIPHKVEVMNYLDEIDEEALEIGAVNTIVREGNKLIGYNTDGRGYLQSLLEVLTGELSEKQVAIIGAGGAARAVVTALKNNHTKRIVVANRTIEKAEQLLNRLHSPVSLLEAQEIKTVESNLEQFDIVINTTSVGMSPQVEQTPICLDKLSNKSIVSDLIYNPIKTKFLTEAEAKGATILNGVGMFVNQGALSFEYWTKQSPNRKLMTKTVLQQLGGYYVNR
ncbi:shikimate dehydrogenase [Alkalihalobacillus trypoxylicola]|uniref:Shikimate dehydrogenase (NADP(+)) n=1 Tax=Alkalihalobacillus trypoxylicola TaxID=519424 RepID=A0A161Q6L5_9BACI|nr:shikimate dehydrogenase [Alkalihalobacillus trypoxylicola]KYG31998.1 shikimate dehydrogenase [Alkalihalobacillus trypoxylicola]